MCCGDLGRPAVILVAVWHSGSARAGEETNGRLLPLVPQLCVIWQNLRVCLSVCVRACVCNVKWRERESRKEVEWRETEKWHKSMWAPDPPSPPAAAAAAAAASPTSITLLPFPRERRRETDSQPLQTTQHPVSSHRDTHASHHQTSFRSGGNKGHAGSALWSAERTERGSQSRLSAFFFSRLSHTAASVAAAVAKRRNNLRHRTVSEPPPALLYAYVMKPAGNLGLDWGRFLSRPLPLCLSESQEEEEELAIEVVEIWHMNVAVQILRLLLSLWYSLMLLHYHHVNFIRNF